MLIITPQQPLPDPGNDYEAEAIRFCQQWLSGQRTFQLYTSGSTGTPKSIELTRAQMQASARLTAQTFGLQPRDRALCCLNIRYIAGIMMLVRTLETHLETVVTEPSSDPLSDVGDIDFAAFAPLQLQKMLEQPDVYLPRLNRMKAMIIGGAAISGLLMESIQLITAPVYATYGMTETVSHIAIQRLNGSERTDYFQALPGVTLGQDDRGCLQITSAASNHELVQTNDVVEMLGENRFRILGRADNIINSGGVKIQLEEVDRLLEPLMQIYFPGKRYFSWGFPHETLGQQLELVIEDTSSVSESSSVFPERLKKDLPAYKNPRRIHFLAHFEHTPSNKVDKKASVAALHLLP